MAKHGLLWTAYGDLSFNSSLDMDLLFGAAEKNYTKQSDMDCSFPGHTMEALNMVNFFLEASNFRNWRGTEEDESATKREFSFLLYQNYIFNFQQGEPNIFSA